VNLRNSQKLTGARACRSRIQVDANRCVILAESDAGTKREYHAVPPRVRRHEKGCADPRPAHPTSSAAAGFAVFGGAFFLCGLLVCRSLLLLSSRSFF